MSNNTIILEEITKNTLLNLNKLPIITPNMYEKVFYEQANHIGINLETLKQTEELLSKEFDTVTIKNNDFNVKKFFDEINKKLVSASENSTKAIKAIDKRDKITLEQITIQMKKIESEFSLLKKELYIDNLTKAKNRKWLYETVLENETFKNNGTMVFIDLNDFKTINDTLGHIIGDKVLTYTVSFIKDYFKNEKCTIVRYAGDEFLIIFEKTVSNLDNLMKNCAEEFSKKKLKIKENKQMLINEINFSVSFSYGISNYTVNDFVGKIIEIADENMYKNKR